jgi:hypothetical protein
VPTFLVNCRVDTIVEGELYDWANFGTDPTRTHYGGSAEHWLRYSDIMIAQARRNWPNADVLGHIKQEWSDGTVVEWDRYADVSHLPTA